MPRLTTISPRDLIRRFRQLGFEGPYTGGRCEFMLREQRRLIQPNPHRREVSADLLARLLRQADVTREEWESVHPQ